MSKKVRVTEKGRSSGRTDRHGSEEVSKMVSTENEGVREGGQVTS